MQVAPQDNRPENRADRLLDNGVIVLVASLIIFLFSKTLSEYDLWGHLKFGLDYLSAGRLLDTDPYSYVTSGYKWIEHCWLFEILIGGAYNVASVLGLTLVKLFFSASILGTLFWHLLRHKVPAVYAGILIVYSSVLMAPCLFPLRPHLATYFLFMLIILVLNKAEEGREKWLYALPVIFGVWCNSHGGYLAGLCMVGVWCAVEVAAGVVRERSLKVLFTRLQLTRIAVVVACAVASLANPYGLELTAFLLRTLSGSRPEITEWQPLSVLSFTGLLYLGLLAASICALCLSTKPRSAAMLALFACAAAQPLAAARHIPFFNITALILCAPHIADALTKHLPADALRLLPNANPAFKKFFAGLLFCSALGLFAFSVPHLLEIDINEDMPVPAVAMLRASGVTGNMAVFFDWGEYCIWHLYPKVKVSNDGRREASYSNAAQALNLKFTYGLSDWNDILKSYNTDIVLAPKSVATFALMKTDPLYVLCYEDGVCGLFVKKGTDAERKLLSVVRSDLHPSYKFP